MQARKIRYEIFGLIRTTRHWPLNTTFDTGEERFLGTCDSRGVGGVDVLVNTNLVMNVYLFEQLTTRIGKDAVVDNIDEEYERLVHHLCDSAKKAEGSRATKRRLSYETLVLVLQRGAARAAGNYQPRSEQAKRCGEAIKKL
ncbi:hypothetical protein ANCCAN_10366 [Ancylostoma caninum]|uniref:Uncharacterized protein n=1 Tax=Ancylostoma caninum TaxID=29170 RepID=A0A368GL93_ANCCA|nr:hypothetical protein ANCCAN_10366 [Ancylostoma caninum]